MTETVESRVRIDQIEGLEEFLDRFLQQRWGRMIQPFVQDMEELKKSPAGTMIRLEGSVEALGESMDRLAEAVENLRAAQLRMVERMATEEEVQRAVERLATKEEVQRLATKEELQRAVERLATKEELQRAVERLATKEELQRLATKEELQRLATKEELQRLATKEELQQLSEWVARLEESMTTRFDQFEKRFALIQWTLAAIFPFLIGILIKMVWG